MLHNIHILFTLIVLLRKSLETKIPVNLKVLINYFLFTIQCPTLLKREHTGDNNDIVLTAIILLCIFYRCREII